MNELIQDIRYAARMLRSHLGFTIVAVITLALGIGANTAIFSVIDAVLLRPLPYDKPEQLVRLFETEAQPGQYPFAAPDYFDWKAQNHTLQDMALYSWAQPVNLAGPGTPNVAVGLSTESNFFSLLGAQALLGRTWSADDMRAGKDRVVILSYSLWQNQFAGDKGILGRTVQINSQSYTVIGVMPATFRYPSFPVYPQLWLPLTMDVKVLGPRGSHSYNVVARMKPGVTAQQVQADLSLIASNLEKQYPDLNFKVGASVIPFHEVVAGRSKNSLTVMMWAVALVLLIACANVANLLLSRAVARQREMAIRSALGAGRLRLVRQLLTESILLGVTGGALGVGIAVLCLEGASSLKNFGLPTVNTFALNNNVLAFTFGLSVLTGVLFGVVPALYTARGGAIDDLKGGAGGIVSHGKQRRLASDTLVVAEMCLALLLLTSAGILLKDFQKLRTTKVGVRSEGILTAAVNLPQSKYKDQPQRYGFEQTLREKLAAIPGVDAVAVSTTLPLEGGSNGYINLRGQPYQPMSGPLVESHTVSPGYFKTFGIPVLQGREFIDADMPQELERDAKVQELTRNITDPKLAPPELNSILYPTVINETMAKLFWPQENPIGKVFGRGGRTGPWYEVIGVTGDVKQWGLATPAQPEAYGIADGPQRQIYVVHSTLPKKTLATAMRRAVAEVDDSLALYAVRSMDDVVADQMASQRLLTTLVSIFSGLALLLAAIGIYGVLSYLVTQRTREIGIRISLGASRGRVLSLVLTQGLRLAVIGVVVGTAVSLAIAKVLASVLHGVSPRDPFILAATAVGLVAVAFVACYIPAHRATRVDPLVALRYE